VHRDLKPANLYLSEDGKVKLGDLGLARDLEGSRLTASGQTVGTWRYMPPEQIRGESNIDGRLDLYALGCIVYQMVAGQVPFDGPDFAAIFDQHLEATPARLDMLVPDCPQPLADLVAHMLEKLPDDRPESAGVVAERLEAIIAGSTTTAVFEPLAADGIHLEADISARGPNLTQRLQIGTEAQQQSSYWQTIAIALSAAALLLALLLVLISRN
jgi:serine/threonine protein kinase